MTAPLSPAALSAHVAAFVATEVPAGKTGALVTVVTADHAQVALALRVGKGWTVDLVAQYAYGGTPTVESRVTKTW